MQHEPCWYAVRGVAAAKLERGPQASTLGTSMHARHGQATGTQKPVECIGGLSKTTPPGTSRVYEPFRGYEGHHHYSPPDAGSLLLCERN